MQTLNQNLNKLISKIPVIGNIVIPKEVGEGIPKPSKDDGINLPQ